MLSVAISVCLLDWRAGRRLAGDHRIGLRTGDLGLVWRGRCSMALLDGVARWHVLACTGMYWHVLVCNWRA